MRQLLRHCSETARLTRGSRRRLILRCRIRRSFDWTLTNFSVQKFDELCPERINVIFPASWWDLQRSKYAGQVFYPSTARCILCSYTEYFICFVTIWLPVPLTFRTKFPRHVDVTERDGTCCKLYRVSSQFQNINGFPKFNQEILDSHRLHSNSLKVFIQYQRRNMGEYINRIRNKN